MRTKIPEAFCAFSRGQGVVKVNARRLLAAASSVALVASFFMASLLLPATARSSEKPKPYAVIFGTVWDPDGHPLYGVKVKIRRADEKKARWELYSNHTGEFAQRVPAGKADYIVWADVKGYKLPSGKKLKPGSEVPAHIDDDERCDIGLHLDW
jgi:hypothetical protein